MGRFRKIEELDQRVRASREYSAWIRRNLATACARCETRDNLEVHHLVRLYHVLLGLWKFYGNEEAVLQHAMAMHTDDRAEGVTLCHDCHETLHPGRILAESPGNTRVALWTVAPRQLGVQVSHCTKNSPDGSVGLVGLQTLFGLGWHVLNGHLTQGTVGFDRREFARLLDKTHSSSFNRSLDEAGRQLHLARILDEYDRDDNVVCMVPSEAYLKALRENPWFFPLEETNSSSRSVVLMLRWFLSTHGSKRLLKIGRLKLAERLHLGVKHQAWVTKTVLSACESIPWTEAAVSNDMFSFRLTNRGAIPVYTLRRSLLDSLDNDYTL